MSIINDKERINITDNHGQKIKLIQELFNSSKLAVLYRDNETGQNGMIHKKKDGTFENTKNHRSPAFALIFLYAYKQAPTVAPNNSLPQLELQIMANNNISNLLVYPNNNKQTKNNNKQTQKSMIKLNVQTMIKLNDQTRIKVLNRSNETTEGAKLDSEIYPIRMPVHAMRKIVDTLNLGTGIYIYGTSYQNTNNINKQKGLNIYYKTNASSDKIENYPITPHPETGSQLINGTPNAPLDASIFANIPGQIKHIIGQALNSNKTTDSGTMLNLENDINKHINKLQGIIDNLYKQYNDIFFVTQNTPLDYIPNNANVNILPIIIHSAGYKLFIENIEEALPNNVGLYLVDYIEGGSILMYVHKQNGKLIQVELTWNLYFKDSSYDKYKQIINHEFIKELIEKNQNLNLQIDYIIGRRVDMTS